MNDPVIKCEPDFDAVLNSLCDVGNCQHRDVIESPVCVELYHDSVYIYLKSNDDVQICAKGTPEELYNLCYKMCCFLKKLKIF